MAILDLLLLSILVLCALAAVQTRDLLGAVIIYAAYSLLMSIIWLQLGAPDVAITEAALGAGVTTILMIATISKTGRYE